MWVNINFERRNLTFAQKNGPSPDDFGEIFAFNLKAHSQVWYNFLTNENPLKLMKNAFYFTSKALFVLKIFKFLSWLFGHVAKQLD